MQRSGDDEIDDSAMVLRRDDWLDLARKVDWTPRYVDERDDLP